MSLNACKKSNLALQLDVRAARSDLPLCFICIFVNILVHDNDIVRAEFGHAWLPKRMGSAGGSLAGHEGTLGWQARRLPRGSKAAAPVKGAAAKAMKAKAAEPAKAPAKKAPPVMDGWPQAVIEMMIAARLTKAKGSE